MVGAVHVNENDASPAVRLLEVEWVSSPAESRRPSPVIRARVPAAVVLVSEVFTAMFTPAAGRVACATITVILV